MKKFISTILLLSVVFAVQAQEETYNKWSIDVRGGLNKPVNSISMSTGYKTTSPLSTWTAGGGFRYMLSNKFGIRLGANYNSFTNADDSKKFSSNTIDVNLQTVANLARILAFENWTSRGGLLLHAGVGLGFLNGDGIDKADQFGSVLVGLTPQVKLSSRAALFLDLTLQMNVKQDYNFDTYGKNANIGFQGFNYMATLGLNLYLGKDKEHADWFYGMSEDDKFQLKLNELEGRLNKLAEKVDVNTGNIAKNTQELSKLEKDAANFAQKSEINNNSKVDVARELINGGYINVYFGFNKSQPTKYSLWAVDFITEYMRKHPGVSVDVIGYADEIGRENYNQRLSSKRADVVKSLIEKSRVNSTKVFATGKGEDNSVDKKSENARQMARRVTFRVK